MLIEDALRSLQECRRHGTAVAVQRSIGLKRHVEEYREGSLGVANGPA
jgi:hypothetical protein